MPSHHPAKEPEAKPQIKTFSKTHTPEEANKNYVEPIYRGVKKRSKHKASG